MRFSTKHTAVDKSIPSSHRILHGNTATCAPCERRKRSASRRAANNIQMSSQLDAEVGSEKAAQVSYCCFRFPTRIIQNCFACTGGWRAFSTFGEPSKRHRLNTFPSRHSGHEGLAYFGFSHSNCPHCALSVVYRLRKMIEVYGFWLPQRYRES